MLDVQPIKNVFQPGHHSVPEPAPSPEAVKRYVNLEGVFATLTVLFTFHDTYGVSGNLYLHVVLAALLELVALQDHGILELVL